MWGAASVAPHIIGRAKRSKGHMKTTSRTRTSPPSTEEGLSLIEVLVAIVVISIVATASATLAITGINAAATQERRQIAVTIASGAMETVSGTAVASLTTGRTATAVQAAWTANSSVAGVPQTYPQWDTAATGTATIAVGPTTVAQAGTNFTVQTLIGACFQPLAGGNCTAPGMVVTSQAPTLPTSAMKLIRAIVIVQWTAGRSCPANCSYVASTLIDPSADLNWITGG